ncbi:MAG: hypothetical protein LBP99_00265 [Azoarcus sp.]|nr:hypothetical protein [Azoarcus sp.]
MKDSEVRINDLLVMQQAQMNVLVSICGALIAHRLDGQNILDGLAKYIELSIAQGKQAAYLSGLEAVVQALRNSTEIFRTSCLPSDLPSPSAKLH